MISKNKTYRTRDGREVRIYATDGGLGQSMIHGAIYGPNGWVPHVWFPDGSHESVGDFDLIEVKPRIKRTVWLNVYENGQALYLSKEIADGMAHKSRLACVKVEIDCEEGEGL
jgi:hypothetical protein